MNSKENDNTKCVKFIMWSYKKMELKFSGGKVVKILSVLSLEELKCWLNLHINRLSLNAYISRKITKSRYKMCKSQNNNYSTNY